MRKEFVPEGKTVNAEFYEGTKDRLLKRIQWVLPDAFCSRNFFLLHNNAPPIKAAIVCQFLTQKILQSSVTPVLSRFISSRLFSVPQLKMNLKGLHFVDVAKIQEAVIVELKKVQKEEISIAFQKMNDGAKACKYGNGA